MLCTSSLISSPAVADEPVPLAHAEPPSPAGGFPPSPSSPRGATVHIRATDGNVLVSRVTDRMMASSGGYTAVGISWKPICMAPCEFNLEPGFHELMISGEGHTPLVRQLQVASGDTYLVADPGSLSLRYGGYVIASFGLAAVALGAVYYFMPDFDADGEEVRRGWEIPMMIGGVAGTGLGVGMMMYGRSSLTEEAPPPGASVPAAVSYRTSF